MHWTPKTPYLTTDGIDKIYNDLEKLLGVVLIQRKNEPIGLALPSGFVDIGESVELEDIELDKLVFDHGKILKDYLISLAQI